MALSIYTFGEECIPPSDTFELKYLSSNPINFTTGGGTTSTYSVDGSSLNIGDNITIPTQCAGGFDIVFLIDITSSMSGAIENVKSGISNILSTINTESDGNYRLGLCVFDENTGTNPSYYSTSTYSNLPASQKVSINNGTGRVQWITCLSPLNNIGSTTAFTSNLSLLNTASFPMGSGANNPEPGGLGVNEIVSNGLAGSFRSDAIKVIILITDNVPGGDDDINNSTDQTYFNNYLTPLCDSLNVQVMVQSSVANDQPGNYYYNLATGTNPAGRYDQVNFGNSNWINTGLISGIQSLCGETYTASCEPTLTGWYYKPGDSGAYYYDSSVQQVTSYYAFPATYSVTPNVYDTDEQGRTIVWTVYTTNISNGTTLYWSLNGNVNSNDFINAISSGQFTINNNVGTFQLTTKADTSTEGSEFVGVYIRTGSVSGTIVATSEYTVISDTSQSLPTPTPTASGVGSGPTPTPTPTSGAGAGPTPTPTPTRVPDPTPTPTQFLYDVYVMDPCDGTSAYVYARSSYSLSLFQVYSLSGSEYADQNYTAIDYYPQTWYDTTVLDPASCDGGGDKCLLEGTMVKLADGTSTAIENLKYGQSVSSVVIGNMPDTDNVQQLLLWIQSNPPLSNTTSSVKNIIKYNVNSVLNFNNDLLISSKDHLHIIKRNNAWITSIASDIMIGDYFIDEEYNEIEIVSIQEMTGSYNVYKLNVESNDTFIANGIITHNAKPLP